MTDWQILRFVWIVFYEPFLIILKIQLLQFEFNQYIRLMVLFEPRHDKTNKMAVHPAKTQISLGILPVWSESLLSAWRNLGFLATHWVHSEDSDQTGWMARLIWVFTRHTLILLVLSCSGSFVKFHDCIISNVFYFVEKAANCSCKFYFFTA